MERAEKGAFIEGLNTVFSKTGVVVVARYTGLSVAEMTALRKRMRAVGAGTKVVKNRLAKRALAGTAAEPIADLFKGPTLVAYSDDPVAAPKVATEFAKTNEKLVVIGGAMGSTTLNADGVKALATLPSLDELRAKILGMIQTPATRIAAVLGAPGAQVARVINAYASKDQAAA